MRKVEKVEKITRVKGSIPKDIRKLIKTEFPAYTNCTPTNPLIIAKSSIVSLFIFSFLTKKKKVLMATRNQQISSKKVSFSLPCFLIFFQIFLSFQTDCSCFDLLFMLFFLYQ